MRDHVRCLLVLALLLGLNGCSTTVFESLPIGTTTDCDPAWPGRWLPVATAENETKPEDVAEISADCSSVITKGEPKPFHVTLITNQTGQYLQVHNDSGEPDCIGEGKAHCGYALMRYERDGDTIRIYDPDHAKVAAAIAKGTLKGFSERPDDKQLKSSEPTYRNFIGGDGKQIDKVLRQHPDLFGAEPLVVLQRVATAMMPADDVEAAADAAAEATATDTPRH